MILNFKQYLLESLDVEDDWELEEMEEEDFIYQGMTVYGLIPRIGYGRNDNNGIDYNNPIPQFNIRKYYLEDPKNYKYGKLLNKRNIFENNKSIDWSEDWDEEPEPKIVKVINDDLFDPYDDIDPCWDAKTKDEIEEILIDIWGQNIPDNWEDIVQDCYEYICINVGDSWTDEDVKKYVIGKQMQDIKSDFDALDTWSRFGNEND